VFSSSSQRPGLTIQDESGFSLIELLVVILVISILAAIAVPSFAAQKGKAQDAQAKELARTAETTAELIGTDNGGEYEHVSTTELNKYERTIPLVATAGGAYLSGATAGKAGYSVTTKATDGDEFTITKTATGEVTRTCASSVTKTGCAGAATGSW
jgi:prepilin-type N-terminal cleavage/methylation domain-containing protein